MTLFCHCGRALHYTDTRIEKIMIDVCREKGEYVRVTVLGRTWLVSRHYIALHGLKGREVPRLGFEEVFG